MFLRAIALLLLAISSLRAQQALNDNLPVNANGTATADPQGPSAWIDLRQTAAAHAKAQVAPPWVESVTLVPADMNSPAPKSVFRIRVAQPRADSQVLMFRLFFDDKQNAQPELVAWDESGSQILHSGTLGSGINLASSDTVIIPMLNVSAIDVEVPGDGSTIRGAYLDWMTSSEVVHPVNAERRDLIPEPFSAAAPMHAPAEDSELFGTVTATLSAETLPIGPTLQQGAAFQFGIESEPLMAVISFEVASPKVDTPPEVYLNGDNLGPVNLTLPDLADPGYRGEAASLVKGMQFQYTGWVRAQKLVPVSHLKAGTNDLLIVGGAGIPASAIRATQIQLKYLWDKSDYVLTPEQ